MQGLSSIGNVSKPPLPEIRDSNRTCAETEKRKKDQVKKARTRKLRQKEKFDRENRERVADDLSPLLSPRVTARMALEVNP